MKVSRRIDAAIYVFKGKDVRWDNRNIPCEVVRNKKGRFETKEIETVFPDWVVGIVDWAERRLTRR